jgi:peptidoglycan-associated lipoprotein
MPFFNVRSVRYPILAAVLITAGCSHNKPVAKVTPPPPPAPSPTATVQVSPENVQAGQTATVTWSTTNASDVQIDGMGTLAASGSRQVSPTQSTNYHLSARGEGGNADATARLTVTSAPVASAVSPSEEELFQQQVKDLYFDYDKYDLRSTDQSTLTADASFLKQHSNLRFVIEGHCDERGSEEYNMALGDDRAETTKKQLISLGVEPSRIKIVSYGKEKPFCSSDNETCFQQNRRAHFSLDR